MLWWKFAKSLMSILKVQVSFPSNVPSIFSAIKQNSPILFLAQILCTLFKRSPLKCKFLRFLSAQIKIRQIPNSSCQFWADKSVPFQILHYFSLPWHITPLQFLNSYIFNFRQKYAIKVPIWRLSSALVKVCQISHVNFWKHKPVVLQILYQSWVQLNITPLYFFSSKVI